MLNRAYSLLDVKSVDENKRVFRGIATTPALDRVNDSIDSLGATFAAEIALLHGHDHKSPIGVVRLGKATKNGIPFEAEIPIIHEPPTLKERVDVAWGELVHGLVRAVSIGFRPLKAPTYNEAGGLDYPAVEIMELSTVAIPAHAGALVHTIKSFDEAAMVAAGVELPTEPNPGPNNELAATGKQARVVRLATPARDGAKPFVINTIRRSL